MEVGVDPYNGLSLNHSVGMKIGGSIFDGLMKFVIKIHVEKKKDLTNIYNNH